MLQASASRAPPPSASEAQGARASGLPPSQQGEAPAPPSPPSFAAFSCAVRQPYQESALNCYGDGHDAPPPLDEAVLDRARGVKSTRLDILMLMRC